MDHLLITALTFLQTTDPEQSGLWNFVSNFSDWLRPNLEEAYYLIASILLLGVIAIRKLRPLLLPVFAILTFAGIVVLKPTFMGDVVDFVAALFDRKG
jgi:hypothetical protein